MKRKPTFRLAVLFLLATHPPRPSTCVAQGSLLAPGAPAPTMKSLAQIEPRTAITNTGAVTISQPGSYYLTTNITVTSGDAITIATNGVTLDLNGFTILSTEASPTSTAIVLTGVKDIHISNGFIRGGVTNNGFGVYSGPGFANGIYGPGQDPANVHVTGVSVSGCLYQGIYLSYNNSSEVEFCTVRSVGASGILADNISHCTAVDCGSIAISAPSGSAADCLGQCTGLDTAIYGKVVNNCRGFGPGGGITAVTAENCIAEGGTYHGLTATTANNCYGTSSGAYNGIDADTVNNCRGTSNNGYGVNAIVANNSYGFSVSSIGLRCVGGYAGTGVATGCYGQSVGYIGLNAYIANGCVGYGPTPISVSFKYNMP